VYGLADLWDDWELRLSHTWIVVVSWKRLAIEHVPLRMASAPSEWAEWKWVEVHVEEISEE
jgi:hypothetical protein